MGWVPHRPDDDAIGWARERHDDDDDDLAPATGCLLACVSMLLVLAIGILVFLGAIL